MGTAGVPVANIKNVANTVMLADVKNIGDDDSGYYGSNIVESPAIATVPDNCGYSNGGWGAGAFGDDPYGEGKPATGTGNVALRHNGGTNIVFCDGHVKWLTPGRLAAGTNWKLGIARDSIVVNDLNQYIWDLE